MTPVVVVRGRGTDPDTRHPCETWLEAWVYARHLRRQGRWATVRGEGQSAWRQAVGRLR